MASRRVSRHSLAPPVVCQDVSYELDNIGALASSQPISLIQLCTKAGSRNRAVKNPRASRFGGTEDGKDFGDEANFYETNQQKPSPRLYPLHSPDSWDIKFSEATANAALPSWARLQEYQLRNHGELVERTRSHTEYNGLDGGHLHKNPLSYDSPCYSPIHSRDAGGVNSSPFLKVADQYRPGYGTWSAGMASVPNRAPVSASHVPHARTLSTKTKDDIELSPSLQIYTTNYDRPYNKSPYETFRAKHRNYRSEIPEITSGLQYSYSDPQYGQCMGYATIRSDPTFPAPVRQRIPAFDADTSSIEPRPPVLTSSTSYSLSKEQPTSTSGATVPNYKFNDPESKKRSLKEEICAILSNMNQDHGIKVGSTTDTRASLIIDKNPSTVQAPQQPDEKSDQNPVLPRSVNGLPVSVEEPKDSISNLPAPEKGSDKNLTKITSKERSALAASSFEYSTSMMKPMEGFQAPPAYAGTAACRLLRPPPGLTKPEQEVTIDFSNSVVNKAKAEEANSWFHKDGRGEEQLRQHISDIAQNYVNRNERLNVKAFSPHENTVAKQTILLLGNAIANLQSYVTGDRKNQATNFADFRTVGSRYCELGLDKCRSYFDRCPLAQSQSSSSNDRRPLANSRSSSLNQRAPGFSMDPRAKPLLLERHESQTQQEW